MSSCSSSTGNAVKRKAGAGGGGVSKRKPAVVHEVFRKPQVCDPANLPKGTFYSCTEVGMVTDTNFSGVEVETATGNHYRISGGIWKHPTMKVPDQTTEELTASQTHVLRVMHEATAGHIFWVRFRKKPKKGEVLGEVRGMFARLHSNQTEQTKLGRTQVMEVVVDPKTGKPVEQKRLVDNRTVKELKFDGVHWTARGIQ